MDSETLATDEGLIARLDQSALGSPWPQVQLLRNEQMVSMLTAAGAGYVEYQGQALTRWRPDPTRDANGYFLYLRDLASGHYWSATSQPTRIEPEDYLVELRQGSARYSRRDHGIQTELEVFLSPTDNVEFRRITLTNLGQDTRNIELTSYAEIVLQDARADAGHLAYSKLFVETWQHESGALCAKRRPRESGVQTLAACQFLAGSDDPSLTEFETDRARFLGRGNSVENPIAMRSQASLSGSLGSVLDPIFSLRKVVEIPAGERVCLTFALAAGDAAFDFTELIHRYQSCEAIESALNAAQEHGALRPEWSARRNELLQFAASTLYGTPNNLAKTEDFSNQQLRFLEHFRIPEPVAQGDDTQFPAPNSTHGGPTIAPEPAAAIKVTPPDFDEELLHWNGFGGFTSDGREYVIRLQTDSTGQGALPPMPWANIVSNEKIGFIASETGAGYTWSANSRLNRLTPWQNDPVSDPHGEAIYVRDEADGRFWSITPGPIRLSVDYEVRHGKGYTVFRHGSNGFMHETTQFVPVDDPVKISWVRLKNESNQPRKISLFSYLQWDLSDGDWQSSWATQTSIDATGDVIFAKNDRRGVFANNLAFAALISPANADDQQHTCDRSEFLGPGGSLSSPLALTQDAELTGRAGRGFDECAVSKTTLEVAPGETLQFAVLLGETSSAKGAHDLITYYSNPDTWSTALEEVQTAWNNRLSAVQVQTPSSAINLMINDWLPYQNLSCRVWGRSSLYQSGGAYGYRDQLQDAAALVHHLPDLTREQILRHAAHQFVEGDVMHWWHPPHSLGIRTMFSDDLLWLPLFAAEYVAATGDSSLLEEQVPFRHGEPLPAGEAEIMLTPTEADESGSLYEHCCRALDRGLTTGRNGLPLMGCGDWNDGMNRVGIGGTGESVWMGFFIDFILDKMLPVCEQRADHSRLERYHSYREQLRAALHDAGWDGGWYRRAYFDDGTPLGTAAADECQIDALVQAWAVLSGADTPERATKAMQAAAERLVDKEAGLIQLLDPPFDQMENDPGYIKGYLPGVRENGGQYTHGILWFIRAMAELGEGSRAVELLEMITPVSHTKTAEGVATYKAEPYVVAADVYSQPPHAGRAGWSWYTGSAGWMWRVAVESILGITLVEGNTLRIAPCISTDWPEYRVTYRLADRKTTYDIQVHNPQGRQLGIAACELDGNTLRVANGAAEVPLSFDGETHQVTVTL